MFRITMETIVKNSILIERSIQALKEDVSIIKPNNISADNKFPFLDSSHSQRV